MKNKALFCFIAFVVLLLLGIVFVNSYVQAISRQEKQELRREILNKEMQNNNIIREQTNDIYINYNNNCVQNENCPIYEQNNNCERHHHNQYLNNNFRRNCSGSMCNR